MSSAGGAGGPQSSKSVVVAEWVRKAEADLDLAVREHSFAGARNLDAVGFHAQQAVEKLMKAVLIDRGSAAPRVHDLAFLGSQLSAIGIGPVGTAAELATLSMGAVHARYPGATISAQDASDMLAIARVIWAKLRPLV